MRRIANLGFGRGRGAPRGSGSDTGGGFSFEDLEGFGGLGDIFSSIFDRRPKPAAPETNRGPAKGRTIEYSVEISFLTAPREAKIPITEECATCGGSGASPGTGTQKCSECKGTGAISFGQGGFAVNRPCPACFGRGQIPESPCKACSGSGTVRQNRRFKITVPKGVEAGSKVRLSGKGERGSRGGKPGDLIITFKIKPHDFFRREGLDIHVTIQVNLVQATLGSKMAVRTVYGKKVHLRIPPGTQSGTKLRVRGHGIQKGERVGGPDRRGGGGYPRDIDRRAKASNGGIRYVIRDEALEGCRRTFLLQQAFAVTKARSIRPPPRTRSPSKKTADCPGVTAR